MRNRGQEKESMRGASGFAEVELKLSTNAARCEGLSYLLSFENIYKNIRMRFCNIYTAYSTQQRIRHMIVHFCTTKQLHGLIRQVKNAHFLTVLKL